MTTLTVSAVLGGTGIPIGGTLRVKVLTGAKPVALQNGGTGGASSSSSINYDQSITIAATGSYVYGCATNFSNSTTFTADGQTTFIDNLSHSVSGDADCTFRSTNKTSVTGLQTFGCTGPTGTVGSVALAEILAGTSLAEDSSGPAVVDTDSASTLTTASFTPPDGSLLVALVDGIFSSTGTQTITFTDNLASHLNWTQLKLESTSNANLSAVWIADVPAASATNIISAANPGKTWKRKFKHQQRLLSPVSAVIPVNVSGVVSNANVVAQAGSIIELIDGTGAVANVNVSGQADNSITEVISGAVSNVTVAGQPGTITELIDGIGQTANVSVSAPAGSILITQNFNPQTPFLPLLDNSLQFNSSYIALRQQSPSGAVFVSATIVSGVTANVNVVSQAGSTSDLIDGTGQAGNVNVSAPAGTVTESTAGTTSAVTVAAVPGQILITQNFDPPFPDSPILPASLKFNPAYLSLRPQHSTALPDVFEPGATANVNVSGQANNTVTESVTGAVGQVNVFAPAGFVLVTTPFFIPSPQPAILHNSIRFNSSYAGLRVQSNTGTPLLPGGSVIGTLSNVNVSGQPDNVVTETITGAVSAVNVSALAGSVTINVSASGNVAVASSGLVVLTVSATVNDPVSALPGSLLEVISGNTGLVNTVAVAGTVTIGGGIPAIVIGDVAVVRLSALPGSFEYINNTTWWRVYRGYAYYPTW